MYECTMAEGLGKMGPICSCGNGQSEKRAKCYFLVPSPLCKSVYRKEDSKQNQFSNLGQHTTFPLLKCVCIYITGGQKQCTETNVSEVNSSKSIVYIEYS